MVAGSGSNQNPEEDRLSASLSPSEETASSRRWQVLIAEDNQSDVYLIQRAIEGTSLPIDLHVVRDGQLAVQFFDLGADPSKPFPDIVILDINLPKKPGDEVLKHVRSHSRWAQVHVIVVSTSDSERDRRVMKELGADGYFHKPSEFDEFMKLGDLVKGVLATGGWRGTGS
jgi:chemotaxis family two-component system response regulator Rcp1